MLGAGLELFDAVELNAGNEGFLENIKNLFTSLSTKIKNLQEYNFNELSKVPLNTVTDKFKGHDINTFENALKAITGNALNFDEVVTDIEKIVKNEKTDISEQYVKKYRDLAKKFSQSFGSAPSTYENGDYTIIVSSSIKTATASEFKYTPAKISSYIQPMLDATSIISKFSQMELNYAKIGRISGLEIFGMLIFGPIGQSIIILTHQSRRNIIGEKKKNLTIISNIVRAIFKSAIDIVEDNAVMFNQILRKLDTNK